jgi:hypothetical protein
VLDGLEGAAAGAGKGFDRATMDRMLSALGNRVFLLNNVHEDAPTVFQTRWTLSYLRGPLTRDQIRTLTAPARQEAAPVAPTPGVAAASAAPPAPRPSGPRADAASTRPVLPPDVAQYFAPARAANPHYEPRLWASAQVAFADPKVDVRGNRTVTVLAPFNESPVGVDWNAANATDLAVGDLEAEPMSGATYADVPPAATKAKSYPAWTKAFAQWLFETQQLDVMTHADTGLTSKGDESEREFRIRLQLAIREQRDAAKAKLQEKYAPKLAAIQEKIRRAQVSVEREQQQESEQKMQTLVSMGATVIGALFGKKMLSATNLGRVTTAARGAGRVMKQSQDVQIAEGNVQAMQQQLTDLEAELQSELSAADASADATTAPLYKVTIKPKKTQIAVGQVLLVWVPQVKRLAAGGTAQTS